MKDPIHGSKQDLNGATKLDRRAFIAGAGVISGLAITRGDRWFDDQVSQASLSELFNAFNSSLSMAQREHTFLTGDHPTRQVTLTEAVHSGDPHIGTLFDGQQRHLIKAMYAKMLSDQGRHWLQNTISLEGRFDGSILKIYSQDASRASLVNSQIVINGGHYMVRSDDLFDSAYALGGPISYGQQIGDHQYQVQGNAYKAHGDALNAFHQALSSSERNIAYQTSPPNELLIQVQGVDANPPGIRLSHVSDSAKEVAREMLDTVFNGFTPGQQRQAWSAIEDNGGIDALSVAMYSDFGFYQDGKKYSDLSRDQRASRGLPYIQVWRIEGPSLVIHFKGYPHVHAYMNIVKNPSRTAIGEVLTKTQKPLDQTATHRLIQSTMQSRTGQSLIYFPEMLLGRVSPGEVSTGSLYTLDPYGNDIVVADIRTEGMSSSLAKELTQQGISPVAGQSYQVATVEYMLRRPDVFGTPENVVSGFGTVRNALIEFVRDADLESYYA